MTGFKHQALKELTDQQVRFAPVAKRAEQRARAERLRAEIDPDKRYPYQFVCFRITDFRPESYSDLLIPGDELIFDLELFIRSLSVPVEEANDPIVTLEEVSKRLNVSTKTVRRWRKLGLIGRRIIYNGRNHVGFKQSALDRFMAVHQDRVERGSRFSQLSDDEKEEILRRAGRLARVCGGTLTEVSRRIAKRLRRSAETIRYTIKNFDREHPEQALFPSLNGPLDAATKDVIYSSYRRGIAVDMLAKRFQRTRTSMYRVINEVRAQRLLEQPLDYIPHPSFEDAAMEPVILAPMPDDEAYEAKRLTMKAPKDVLPQLAPHYEVPLLNKDQEQHLFRKFNYLKYKASKLRSQLRKGGLEEGEIDPTRVRIQVLKEIEDLQVEANAVRDRLIQANMRLVVHIAKKHVSPAQDIFELMSDGNMSLMRAVEKFDFGRGFKFSTYASWAIIKNFARSVPDEKHRRERFVTGHEDVFEAAPDLRSDEHEMLVTQERAKHSINRLLEYLEPRERDIIRMRAGMDDHHKNMTLEEIGQQFGITKERVRQLNQRAMNKLRAIARQHEIEMP